MAWTPKEQPSAFDTLPIDGLFFLGGDLLFQKSTVDWTHGEKSPMIAFPSGLTFPLWEQTATEGVLVYLGGDVALPLNDNRDHAYLTVVLLAEQSGYRVRKLGENGLGFLTRDPSASLFVLYDNLAKRLVNVALLTERPPVW
ncbi:MAG: hypothetical protein ACYDBJ_00680 [Aggregatilineales bacterium]